MDPFLAEIRIFGCNYAPQNWALCNGQLLPISQNTALFSIIGATYGGNGINIFGLPNLQGNVPMGAGNGPGLTPRTLGEEDGSATVTLTQANIPPHAHSLMAEGGRGTSASPAGALPARAVGAAPYAPPSGTPVAMAQNAIASYPGGSGQPHNNLQPYLAVNFNICLNGVFPPRS